MIGRGWGQSNDDLGGLAVGSGLGGEDTRVLGGVFSSEMSCMVVSSQVSFNLTPYWYIYYLKHGDVPEMYGPGSSASNRVSYSDSTFTTLSTGHGYFIKM